MAKRPSVVVTWYFYGVRVAIDRAGRLVIPKPLRDRVGIRPGELEVFVEGAGLRIQPIAGDELVEQNGVLVVPPAGVRVDDDMIAALRNADQQ